MNKVYIVTRSVVESGENDENSIIGVFSTKTAAENRFAEEVESANDIFDDDFEVVTNTSDYFCAENEDRTLTLTIAEYEVR